MKKRNFNVDIHFVKGKVSKGVVENFKVSSDYKYNMTFIFTKTSRKKKRRGKIQ